MDVNDPSSEIEPPLVGFHRCDDWNGFLSARLQYHQAHPDVTSDNYSRQRRIDLGEAVCSLTRVYLDTKFWIYLRDAAIGCPAARSHKNLLGLLEHLVESRIAVCPLADCAFLELMKQGNTDRRLATARVMDNLSLGVSLKSHGSRVAAEILYFVGRYTLPSERLHPLEWLVWTRSGFVMGDVAPYHEDLPPDINEAIAKTFDDQAWSTSLERMLGDTAFEAAADTRFYSELATELTDGKFRHEGELTDFRSTFLSELRGALAACRDDLDEAIPYLYRAAGGTGEISDEERADSGRLIGNAIYLVMEKDHGSHDMRTLSIQAAIHAAIRWDRRRRYKTNDWLDILHAAAGLGYNDIFLTERSLASLVRNAPLELDGKFGVQVAHTVDDAIAILERLSE